MNFAISPDGSQFAVAGLDDRITMWDSKTAKPLYSIPGHGEKMPLNVLGFTESGSELVSCGVDLYLRTTDVKTGRATREYRLEQPKPTASQLAANTMTVSFMLNAPGSHLVIRGPELASVYEVTSGKVVSTWKMPKMLTRNGTSALSRTGETIFLFERDDAQPDPGVPSRRPRLLTAWNTATGELIWRVELADAVVQAMHLSPDGQWIPITISRPNGTCDLAFYSTQNGKEGGRIKAIPSVVCDAVFRAEGKQIVVGLTNHSALVYPVPELPAPVKP